MMAPTVVVGERRPRLVVGSAGSVRLRGAIMQVIANVVGHGLGVAAAIDAPRVHVDEPHVHCEGGFDAAELDRVESMGYDVVRWRRRNLFFGGTNAVEIDPGGELAAAGDARRGGAGLVVGDLVVSLSGSAGDGDLAVRAGALAQRLLEANRLERDLEQRGQSLPSARAARSSRAAPASRRRAKSTRAASSKSTSGESGSGTSTGLSVSATARRTPRARARRRAVAGGSSSSTTASTMPVVNDRPLVSSSRRKRSPPSTTMSSRPSSRRSSTSSTVARVPISCTAPSSVAKMSPNSPPVSRHSSISSR